VIVLVTAPELVEDQYKAEYSTDQDSDGGQITGVQPDTQPPPEQPVGPYSGYKIAEGCPRISATLLRLLVRLLMRLAGRR
jgi:hypothetical protein